jgi:hypothetical protein
MHERMLSRVRNHFQGAKFARMSSGTYCVIRDLGLVKGGKGMRHHEVLITFSPRAFWRWILAAGRDLAGAAKQWWLSYQRTRRAEDDVTATVALESVPEPLPFARSLVPSNASEEPAAASVARPATPAADAQPSTSPLTSHSPLRRAG